MNDFILSSVNEAQDLAYRIVLMKPGTKIPLLTGWQERVMSRAQIEFELKRNRCNYGTLLGEQTGVCVLDKDGRSAKTTAFLRDHGARSPMEVLTKHGTHSYFRIPGSLKELRSRIKWLGLGLDVKLTGVAVGRGSVVDGWTYRLKAGKKMVAKADLPILPDILVNMLNDTMAKMTSAMTKMTSTDTNVNRIRKYVSFITARCHAGAHNQAFRCACKIADLIKDYGLAMEIYREWNAAHAVAEDGKTPFPFSEQELNHKMTDAFRRRP